MNKITTASYSPFNPIQTGLFLLPGPGGGGGGGLRRPYTFNSITAYGMATKFTQNDVLICSII